MKFKFILSLDNKNLLSNFFSLTALQGVNMILPLITLPYLVRILGVETFGLLNFSLAIIMFFNLIVGFGFDLSATREISIYRNDKKRINKIFTSIILFKVFLTIVTFLFLLTYLVAFENSQALKLYIFTFGLVIGNLFLPTWFFQGIEKMKYLTYVTVISRIGFTALIFVLVQKKSDYLYVPVLNSLGSITAGFLGFYLAFRKYKVRFIKVGFKTILDQIILSWYFFISRIANEGSRYFATYIIGVYFGNVVVGYFSMAEKLFYAFNTMGGIVAQTLFPYMSRTRNLFFFKKTSYIVISISLIVLIPTIYFHDLILFLVFGIKEEILSSVFIIIISSSIFAIASSLIGYPLLAAFGHLKFANNSLVFASLFYIIFILFAVAFFQNLYLAAGSVVVYHFLGLLFRIYYLTRTNILKTQIQI